MQNPLSLSSITGLVPWGLRRAAGAVALLALLGSAQGALAQACSQVVNFNYTNATPDGSRMTGSDKLSAGTPGTTVTYSNYTGTGTAATNTFAVGANAVLGPGKFLVWQRNVVGGGPTSDVSTVTLTFSRPVSNLTMSFSDIDKDVVNGSFIDRMTFDAYPTTVVGTPISLQPSNFAGPGINNNIQRFVGAGSTATATSDPAFKANALTGIATSTSITTSDVTVSFPSPVQRVDIAYENIAPIATTTTDRTHTIGFETINFCAQADVYANFTAATTAALPGGAASYTVVFGNNGPDDSQATTRRVSIPAGATITNAGGGTIVGGNTIDFGTVLSAAGSSATFTYGYTLPTTPGVYYAATTATTTTGAGQNGQTANDTQTRTAVVTPITDIATTLTGPTSATQGNLVTLNVTTSNLGSAATANVAQTVQLVGGLSNVFVSNGGTYNPANGLVTYPTLATLASGQTMSNYVTFAAPATSFAPTASVTPNTPATGDSNPPNNAATLNGASAPAAIAINPTTAATKVANLYTTIASSTAATSPGSDVTLTVVTANAGPTAGANVVETVQLLPGLNLATLKINGATFASQAGTEYTFAGGAKYDSATGLVTFAAIPSLASAASVSNTITLTVPASVNSQFQATAFVGATTTDAALRTTDPVPADNLASTKISVSPTADLAAVITGVASVLLGQPVTYTAVFTNNGPSAVVNQTPTVQLPAGLTGVVASSGGTYNAANGLVTFPALATTPPGVSELYTVTFTPPATGSYKATAATNSSTPDPTAANNSASVTTTVTPSYDLSVRVSVPANSAIGGPVTFVSQTSNSGPSVATAVVTTIQLPVGLAVASVTFSPGGSYDPVTGKVSFTTASLGSGATVSHYANFTNTNTAVANGNVSTTATVNSTPADSDPTNNGAFGSGNTTGANVNASDASTTLTSSVASASPGTSFLLTVTFGLNNVTPANVDARLYLPPGTVVGTVTGGAFTYNMASGVVSFTGSAALKKNQVDTYTLSITAPGTNPFSAVSAISTTESETNTANNVASVNVNITQPAAPTTYDEVSALTGPASAVPGAVLTYTVQSINNGPANSGTVVQRVTLPPGVTATTISNGGTQAGQIITYPAISNQAPGPAGVVNNTFTVTMPASGNLVLSTTSTAGGETNAGNNTAEFTTNQANQAPVAASIVNALKAPLGNSADQQLISPLAATDADGIVTSYRLLSIPDAATQGVLYFLGGGGYTAITSATFSSLVFDPSQNQFKFDPVATFVGNVFFNYVAADNGGITLLSQPALYTIQVGQDTDSKYTTVVKGATNPYVNGDVVATVFDVNGGKYTSAGAVDQTNDGNGVVTATMPATGPVANPTNALPAGIAFDPATGQFTVTDRTLLRTGSYSLRITTLDVFGGTNTQDIVLAVGNAPLPVELTAFTAKAVADLDAALAWATASEKDNDHFDVERSLNGTDFATIARVQGQGSKSSPTDYALLDAGVARKATGAAVYYRLRQVDTDGTASYSPVRAVAFAQAPLAIGLFPNPALEATQLDLTQLPTGRYQVHVIDATGRTVLATTLEAGLAHRLNLNTIGSGTYTVLVRGLSGSGSVNLTKRLIKK